MISYLKEITIRNLVSPYGLSAISYGIFLFGWLFPPALYTQLIAEPDLMFLDPLTFVFYSACVLAFVLGVRISGIARRLPSDRFEQQQPVTASLPAVYLAVPLVIASIGCSIYMVMLGVHFNSIALLAAQQGDMMKLALQSGDLNTVWAAFLVMLTAVLWWALYRAKQLQPTGLSKTVFYCLFWAGVVIDVLTCIARVDRTNLMPLLAGLITVYLFSRTRAVNVRLGRLFASGVCAGIVAVGGFFALSFLRGAFALRLMALSFMGYTVVSYNRLAAMLSGLMHYAYEHSGVYLAIILNQDEKAAGLRHSLGWPDSFTLWQTEFTSTYAAGLNPIYIWSGTFGYLYSDLGWWTPAYVFLSGVLAGFLWSRFVQGRISGVILYPWIAFCIFFWTGTNYLLDGRVFRLLEVVCLLWIYDWIFLKRGVAQRMEPPGAQTRRLFQPFASETDAGGFS